MKEIHKKSSLLHCSNLIVRNLLHLCFLHIHHLTCFSCCFFFSFHSPSMFNFSSINTMKNELQQCIWVETKWKCWKNGNKKIVMGVIYQRKHQWNSRIKLFFLVLQRHPFCCCSFFHSILRFELTLFFAVEHNKKIFAVSNETTFFTSSN